MVRLKKSYNREIVSQKWELQTSAELLICLFNNDLKGYSSVIGKKKYISIQFFLHILIYILIYIIVWDLENENDLEITHYPPHNCMRKFKRVFLETTFFKSGVYFSHKLLDRSTCNFAHTY